MFGGTCRPNWKSNCPLVRIINAIKIPVQSITTWSVHRIGDTNSQVALPSSEMVAGGKQCASRSSITPTKHALQIFTDASKEGWGAHLNTLQMEPGPVFTNILILRMRIFLEYFLENSKNKYFWYSLNSYS